MADEDVLKQLDSTINAIESQRDWREQQRIDEEARLNAAWEQVLEAAAKLRSRLQGNPKLRYFTIARDGSEVGVSFHARSGGGSNMLSFHRRHPEGKFPTTNTIWCREQSVHDQRFDSAEAVIQKLVRHCAANLTGS